MAHHHPHRTAEARDVRWAWLCLLLPLAFACAFLVGEGLISQLGYEVGAGEAPLWAAALALVPALVVFAVPALLASWFAHRAAARGDRRGWVPAGILIGVAVLCTLMNLLAPLLGG